MSTFKDQDYRTHYPHRNISINAPVQTEYPKKEFIKKIQQSNSDGTTQTIITDARCDVIYDHWYNNNYKGQEKDMFRVIKIFNSKSNNKIMLKIQFISGTILTISFETLCKNKSSVYDPYYTSIYNRCAIGNIIWNKDDLIDEDINNSYAVWKIIVSRIFNMNDPLYRYFGGNGWYLANPTWRYFEFFYVFNCIQIDNHMLPLLDANDWRLYIPPMCYNVTREDKVAIQNLPYPIDACQKSLSMRIKDLKFDERTMEIRTHTGRPRGAKNKPKEEPPKEKVQMYRVIDPSKG